MPYEHETDVFSTLSLGEYHVEDDKVFARDFFTGVAGVYNMHGTANVGHFRFEGNTRPYTFNPRRYVLNRFFERTPELQSEYQSTRRFEECNNITLCCTDFNSNDFTIFYQAKSAEEAMTIKKTSPIYKLFTPLTDAQIKRNEGRAELFSAVAELIRQGDAAFYTANNVEALTSTVFSTHPFIHRYYYDAKKKGTLYVKEMLTGKLIRKDESVLLSNGSFIKRDSPLIVDISNPTHRRQYFLSALGLSDWADDKYVRYQVPEANDQVFIPFSRDYCLPALSEIEFLQYFETMARDHQQNFVYADTPIHESSDMRVSLLKVFGSVNNIAETADNPSSGLYSGNNNRVRIAFTKDYNNINVSTIHIPNTSPILPGFLIKLNSSLSNYYSNFDGLGGLVIGNNEHKPTIILGRPSSIEGRVYSRLGTSGARQLPQNCKVSTWSQLGLVDCPFNFAVVLPSSLSTVQENKTTLNDREGRVMPYSTKITDYKICFKMTEEESKRHAFNVEQFKLRKKDMKVSLDKLSKEYEKMLAPFGKTAESAKLQKRIANLQGSMRRTTASSDAPIFMGFELELQTAGAYGNSDGFMRTIRDIGRHPQLGNHVIIKHDGSTGTNGLEIVSIPATLQYHKSIMKEVFFKEDVGFSNRFKSSDLCGIHVHISKDCLNKYSIGRLIAFINSPNNAAFINAMAGRKENSYCQRLALKGENKFGVDVSASIGAQVSMENENRHMPRGATNLMNTAKTIEIRIFKSTTQENNFLRKLEFCEALVKFCRQPLSHNQVNAYEFVQFITAKDRRKDYPHLMHWLGDKKYVEYELIKMPEKTEGKKRVHHVYGDVLMPKPNNSFYREQSARSK